MIHYIVLIITIIVLSHVMLLLTNNKETFLNQEYRQVPSDPRYSWLSSRMEDHSIANQLPYVQWPRDVDNRCDNNRNRNVKECEFARKHHLLTKNQFERYSIGITLSPQGTIQKGYLKGWPKAQTEPSSWVNPILLDWHNFE